MSILPLDSKLYFSSINFDGINNDFWQKAYNETGPGGKFAINLARRINPNRFVSRDSSIWTTPWPQECILEYRMLPYDPNFTKTFSEVSDERALEIKARINSKNEKFAVMYSGGIDSVVIMVALLKNLTEKELKNIAICASTTAIIEYPSFWEKYLYGKFVMIDSMINKYDTLINQGYIPITGDDGDCLHGTVLGLNFYHNWENLIGHRMTEEQRFKIRAIMPRFNDPDIHYSEFQDALIPYFYYSTDGKFPLPILNEEQKSAKEVWKFGRQLYDKYDVNCKTASVPINSLHDFFWWLIFNVKMLNCGIRGAVYYNDSIPMKTAIHTIENWYMYKGYQLWSMNNNNNGTKIGNSPATYKKVARDYIFDFDKNYWYKTFKLKIESMGKNSVRQAIVTDGPYPRPAARFGLTTEYELLSIDDKSVQDYIQYHLNNFEITWSDIK